MPLFDQEAFVTGIGVNRRRLLGMTGSVFAASTLKNAEAVQPDVIRSSVRKNLSALPPEKSSRSLRRVRTGELETAYSEAGSPEAPVVILLHGWPYDIQSFAASTAILVEAGYRVIAPYVRGFGSSRFLSSSAPRNAQQAVLAIDVIQLMDALRIESALLAGFDWGARTANIIAALWPGRCRGMVSVSGYLIGSRLANQLPLSPESELSWWYQFYFGTERGYHGYKANRRDFARLIWKTASPQWRFDEATFAASAVSLENEDHAEIVIHNYRWRLGLAEGDTGYDAIERKLEAQPAIRVPTITLEGDANGAPHPLPATYAGKFLGPYSHRLIEGGVGHNLPQEAPAAFAQAILDVARF